MKAYLQEQKWLKESCLTKAPSTVHVTVYSSLQAAQQGRVSFPGIRLSLLVPPGGAVKHTLKSTYLGTYKARGSLILHWMRFSQS